ncbi:DUF1254 domain-containing protein [soil metagenome]
MKIIKIIFSGLFMSGLAACGGGSSVSVSASVQDAANAAFQYGYPLTETMRVCDLSPNLNQLSYKTTLSTAADRSVVKPNNDTLYGLACIYLGSSWAVVTMPPANGRYMSLQVLDAYTNNVAVLGPRQIPTPGSQYVLHLIGSSTEGMPPGVPVIEMPTHYGYIITRTYVEGSSDLNAAVVAQKGITLVANSPVVPSRAAPTGSTPGTDFFLKLMFRLAQNPPPASEKVLIASFVPAGIVATTSPSISNATPAQIAAWESAYTSGLRTLNSGTGSTGTAKGIWGTAAQNIGNFGTDYAFRAFIAKVGLFALSPSEATYLSASTNSFGVSLDGRVGYTLTLPGTGWPPVTAPGFWSLTMYGADNFLVENSINRYSIGGRTPGLKYEPDGSLNIYVQCTDPGGARTSNWLPAPCGPYGVTMRLYMPTAAVLNGTYVMPPLR